MRRSIFTAGVFAFVVALGCASDSTSALSAGHTLASITVSLSATSLIVGSTTQATASLLDDAGQAYNNATVSWSSSNSAVASVSSSGLVTAASAGNAVITASAQGKTASAAISISAVLPASVATILVTLDSGALHVGNTARANAVVKDSAGNLLLDRAVSWSTSNPILAVVSGLGIVTAVAPGSVSISGASEGRVGSAAVTVLGAATAPGQPAAPTVALALDATTIPVGTSTQATAILKDSTGAVISAGGTPVWSSSDETVVTVGATGTITAISTGTAAVTATFAKASGTTVVVTKPATPATVASVSVVVSSPLTVGVSATAVAIPKDSAGHALTGRTVSSWVSTDPTVASVSITGVVTPIKNGTTSIVATISGKTGSAPVNVGGSPTITAVTVVVDSGSLTVGHTGHATANPRDASGTLVGGKTATWSSSNTGVLTVGTDGSFTAVAGGSADVTADFGGVTGKATVSVGSIATLATVTVSFIEGTVIVVPNVTHATAVLKSSAGSVMSGTVTWSTSNAAVATVGADGSVKATGPGSAHITATSGSKSGSGDVFVPAGGEVVSEPVYDASKYTLVMSDDMESYTTAVAMGDNSVPHVPRIVPSPAPITTSQPVSIISNQVISPGHGGTGKALRMSYPYLPPFGPQIAANLLTMYVPKTPVLATHYFSYYARVNMDAPLTSVSPGELAVKWFMVWHTNGGRVEWHLHNHLPWTGGHHPNYWQLHDQADTYSLGTQPVGPYLDNLIVVGPTTPSQLWHRFTYAYRPNTAKGSRDGFAQMWIDGIKVIDVSLAAAGVTPLGGEKPWCNLDDIDALDTNDSVDHIAWGAVQTTSAPAWTYDIDDFKWWRTP